MRLCNMRAVTALRESEGEDNVNKIYGRDNTVTPCKKAQSGDWNRGIKAVRRVLKLSDCPEPCTTQSNALVLSFGVFP